MQLHDYETKSLNHQINVYDDDFEPLKPVKRYCKTVPSMVSLKRLNPDKTADKYERELEVLLRTRDDGVSSVFTFRYIDDVVELYSAREVQHFERVNDRLLKNGVIMPYDDSITDGTPLPLNTGDLD